MRFGRDTGAAQKEVAVTNGTDPAWMTPEERLDEVGMLLSLAMMRLWLKRRRAACGGERGVSRDWRQDCLELSGPMGPDGTVTMAKE